MGAWQNGLVDFLTTTIANFLMHAGRHGGTTTAVLIWFYAFFGHSQISFCLPPNNIDSMLFNWFYLSRTVLGMSFDQRTHLSPP